jgi:hypothetical protein
MYGVVSVILFFIARNLFQVHTEEFPDFGRCVHVLIGPGGLSFNNFIEPHLVSVFAVDESVCNHFVAAQR